MTSIMGITALLVGVCYQSDSLAETTQEVVETLLKCYYEYITQVGGVRADCQS